MAVEVASGIEVRVDKELNLLYQRESMNEKEIGNHLFLVMLTFPVRCGKSAC